ncbi:Uncharacterized membrane protein YeiB [Nocardiopsis flavescens]|uniref:Uncharacterized membrane protein YeiB n=1 Tax=Nocardiopsis flavescens TaxID=758803 RepID=A0A1M6L4K4_9ACTN|nr:DUF418 domain-containing protein [Nocardiopsis flavescens]SHJ66165.1 Uncharacterized membrane protein YeiB [Nocardiopsis flavescens]
MATTPPAASTPLPAAGDRSPAPDLARGVMLLAIAVAHTPPLLAHWGTGALDRAALFTATLLAEDQARLLFVLLFGYGLGQLVRREAQRGSDWPDTRALLRRRGAVLLLIGFLHTLLLPLDIVAVYGTALLLVAPLVRARTSTLVWTGALTAVPGVLMLSVPTVLLERSGVSATLAPMMAEGPLAHVLGNLQAGWPLETLLSLVTVLPALVLGIAASRLRVLEEPHRHRDLLVRAAVVLGAVSLAGRLPHTLVVTGLWPTESAPLLHTASALHVLSGHAGGFAAAALVGLWALRPVDGPFATAVAALGRRSLTFYLFQSVVFVALLYPFTLGLADDLGAAAGLCVATALWAVSLALAEWMRRTGRRGPAETLLRRLTRSPWRVPAGR